MDAASKVWDDHCDHVAELFGRIGERYTAIVHNDFEMSWIFRNEHDAILFRLKFGEVCT